MRTEPFLPPISWISGQPGAWVLWEVGEAEMTPSPPSAINVGLQSLDLSWNHLYIRGVVALCNGLRVSLQERSQG